MMRNPLMAALVCGVVAIAIWLARLRSPSLPLPIISNPDHQNTIAHICDVYRDYLSFSSATQVQTLYEALGLDAVRNPGVADVWLALRDRVEGNYYANGAPLDDDDDGPSVGLLHGHDKGDLRDDGDGEPRRLPPPPPPAPQATDVWAQIGNVLIDSKLRTTYDQAFMPVLTGLGVDRTAALSRTCRWNEEQ
ncbi:uncharacterized protein LY79DRAFT_584814 [Colletotrichum navitas]|uniref:Uncharacterized protein n=1 Tax=Colletotrichum navitas TaxID=681940 RepID=A0AAD8PKK7_9PEZI|nr:uncharacterized protein LY79DRAFT_584814 [Colletotrichum navitas]KAK1566393.1 hypothetical protein LY79DRAFT_584814 [Colletotrichum navitas]